MIKKIKLDLNKFKSAKGKPMGCMGVRLDADFIIEFNAFCSKHELNKSGIIRYCLTQFMDQARKVK